MFDLLKDFGPVARRFLRALIGFVLAYVILGVIAVLQEVVFPELKILLGDEIWGLLYASVLAGLIASLAALSKYLRENFNHYLPF